MNYQAHYDRLVERARNRILTGYVERHHAIPRCMGGTDDKSNIVSLTAREHFVAHQLLVKIYPKEGGLIAAVRFLTSTRKGNPVKSRMYEWLRVRHARQMSVNNTGKKRSPEVKAKISAALKGKKKPEAFGAIISQRLIGNKNSAGIKQSDEHIAKRAAANSISLAKPLSEEHKTALKNGKIKEKEKREALGIAHFNKGKKRSAEDIEKTASAIRGKKQSPEHKAKRLAAMVATKLAKRESRVHSI